jgi:hypothetical protein
MKFRNITLTQLVTSVVFAVMLATIFILYGAKIAYFQSVTESNPPPFIMSVGDRLELTPNSVLIVQQFLKTHPDIDVVGVVNFDMVHNTRTNMLRMFNDKALEAKVQEQIAHPPEKPQPLFTSDIESNSEISSLLSNQFTCNSGESIFTRQYGLRNIIHTTCRVPIPPYYGRVTGYIVLYSKKEMSIYEKDQLRIAAIRLAVDMYYQGVQHPGV